jgi:hypothetical protein
VLEFVADGHFEVALLGMERLRPVHRGGRGASTTPSKSESTGGLLALWGITNPPYGDLDGNQRIDDADLGLLLSHWGVVN